MTRAVLTVRPLRREDLTAAARVLDRAIRDVWMRDGIGDAYSVDEEIARKQAMLADALDGDDTAFLVALEGDEIVGTVSLHPIGAEILAIAPQHAAGAVELGSLYVVPERQGSGIGTALIAGIVTEARRRGIVRVAFDAGYRRSAELWRRRFGKPTVHAVDYWGPGGDHLVWIRSLDELS